MCCVLLASVSIGNVSLYATYVFYCFSWAPINGAFVIEFFIDCLRGSCQILEVHVAHLNQDDFETLNHDALEKYNNLIWVDWGEINCWVGFLTQQLMFALVPHSQRLLFINLIFAF